MRFLSLALSILWFLWLPYSTDIMFTFSQINPFIYSILIPFHVMTLPHLNRLSSSSYIPNTSNLIQFHGLFLCPTFFVNEFNGFAKYSHFSIDFTRFGCYYRIVGRQKSHHADTINCKRRTRRRIRWGRWVNECWGSSADTAIMAELVSLSN